MDDNEQEWIDVEDNVPQPYITVICYSTREIIRTGFISDDGVWYIHGLGKHCSEPCSVSLWQPVPNHPAPKLLLCPFCGEKPKVIHNTHLGNSLGYNIKCPWCGVCFDTYKDTKTAAVEAWNMRL